MMSVALAAAALLLAQIVFCAIGAAIWPKRNIYVTIIAVSVGTAPAVFFMDGLLFGETLSTDGRIYLVVMHLTLGGFLFHFMTLPDRSVTLRILVELFLAPGQVLSVAELKQRYTLRAMIESRLAQLSAGDFIGISSEGAITLKRRGLWFSRFVTGGRRLFKITSAN